ncbi:MAG: type I DNA topoisomerase [Erysipelotrichaceae bacterium]|jgi:DNA topoisomerase-1|nr:type I DNA topoisomerase [Erysipelotrichaceae bacterium]
MKNLVIVESPSKSKTIQKYLGKDFEVVSSKGHIRDLAIKGKDGLGVDIENNFAPTYVVDKDKVATVKDLKSKASKSDKVYLATDPDREGEAISWHLANELGLDEKDQDRVVFHEITKDAVQQAFRSPRTIDMDLVHSQETRRILDRILGFKLSKLLQSKIKSKSAGRVQSVALKLIVQREKEIQAFVPEEYWSIHADFDKDGILAKSELSKIKGKKAEVKNQEEADKIVSESRAPFTVSDLKTSVRSRKAKPPFITSTLQQEASTKLGFSAKKTMSVAQRLYEGISVEGQSEGLITYMRTDSTRLSNQFMAAAGEMIENTYGKDYRGYYSAKVDANAQDAHEAIRPTHVEYTPERLKSALNPDQHKLYSLIYARAIAALMAPAKFDAVSVTFHVKDYDYTANGSVLIFPGYLKVYGDYESVKDEILPVFVAGEVLDAKDVYGKQHFTEPPLRYSEARLIKEMEELGIGRPSTYATIIDTIQARGYVTLEKGTEGARTKVFVPTERGVLTDEKLGEFFSDLINVKYTANMEQDLDKIAEGDKDRLEMLRDFYNHFSPMLEKANKNMEKVAPVPTGEMCPQCGHELVIREGRYGKFISCSNYPACKFSKPLEGESQREEPQPTGELCPQCGKPLVKRKSRYGKFFVSCSGYPECKYIQREEPEPTGELCPECGKPLVKRKSRYGTYFISCSGYPACKYIQKDKKAAGDKPVKKKATAKKTTKKKS